MFLSPFDSWCHLPDEPDEPHPINQNILVNNGTCITIINFVLLRSDLKASNAHENSIAKSVALSCMHFHERLGILSGYYNTQILSYCMIGFLIKYDCPLLVTSCHHDMASDSHPCHTISLLRLLYSVVKSLDMHR